MNKRLICFISFFKELRDKQVVFRMITMLTLESQYGLSKMKRREVRENSSFFCFYTSHHRQVCGGSARQ